MIALRARCLAEVTEISDAAAETPMEFAALIVAMAARMRVASPTERKEVEDCLRAVTEGDEHAVRYAEIIRSWAGHIDLPY